MCKIKDNINGYYTVGAKLYLFGEGEVIRFELGGK